MKVDASFAAQLYDNAKKISPDDGVNASDSAPERPDFSAAMAEAGQSMMQSLETGETAMMSAMRGEGDVQAVVEALTATELALETAVTVRNRVVEAYQELLRMPI